MPFELGPSMEICSIHQRRVRKVSSNREKPQIARANTREFGRQNEGTEKVKHAELELERGEGSCATKI